MLTSHVAGFLRAAIVWLVLGTSLGVAMAVHPVWAVYRIAHFHMLLLGFVTMFIAGVAYHVVPRFTMAALASTRLAMVHLIIANIGLALMVLGFCARVHGWELAAVSLAVGGSLSALGAWAFAWNIWVTMGRTVVPPPRPPGARPLPNAVR
jgi:cbb3-type cytochrome oxidase subunit 1